MPWIFFCLDWPFNIQIILLPQQQPKHSRATGPARETKRYNPTWVFSYTDSLRQFSGDSLACTSWMESGGNINRWMTSTLRLRISDRQRHETQLWNIHESQRFNRWPLNWFVKTTVYDTFPLRQMSRYHYWDSGGLLGGVSHVVWGQSYLEVSAFVQILSSVKNGGRPEAFGITSLLLQSIPQSDQTFENSRKHLLLWSNSQVSGSNVNVCGNWEIVDQHIRLLPNICLLGCHGNMRENRACLNIMTGVGKHSKLVFWCDSITYAINVLHS